MAEVELQRDGGVLTITLNRPDVLNALNASVHAGLRDGLAQAASDPSIRAVVITGAGRGFCVGQDLNEFGEAARDIAGRLRGNYHPTIRAVRELEKPVIAA
ncbi:MAG TPA: enoyl-CoA hydratase-related protein, partial [Gaiellaceae bacterium]|nr:enoyl-CoA hydratase-related protein [Gaiellaceae bacterium]